MVTICWAAKGGSGTTVVTAALALSSASPTLLVDLDGDGHLDLVATTGGADNMMQVWFGPLIEPLPDTGDTGTAPTGATGTTGHTGTDAETGPTATDSAPADTGSPPEEPAETEPSAETGACGCQATGSSLWAVTAPWARR